MIIKNVSLAIVFSLSIISLPTKAAKTIAQCDEIKDNEIKASRCFDTIKLSIDRELQTWINNFLLNIGDSPENASSLRMFKRSQQNFVTFRENDCRWQYLFSKENIRADMIYKKCYISLSQQRIKELSLVE